LIRPYAKLQASPRIEWYAAAFEPRDEAVSMGRTRAVLKKMPRSGTLCEMRDDLGAVRCLGFDVFGTVVD